MEKAESSAFSFSLYLTAVIWKVDIEKKRSYNKSDFRERAAEERRVRGTNIDTDGR